MCFSFILIMFILYLQIQTQDKSSRRYDKHKHHSSSKSSHRSSKAKDAAIISKQKALWDAIQTSRKLDVQLAGAVSKHSEKRKANKAKQLAYLQGETVECSPKKHEFHSPVRSSRSRKRRVYSESRSKDKASHSRKVSSSSHHRTVPLSPNEYVSPMDESGFSSHSDGNNPVSSRRTKKKRTFISSDSSPSPSRE